MRIGTKLMVIGALVLALPLATVAYFAVTQATEGLQRMNNEKLSTAAQDLAQLRGADVGFHGGAGENVAGTAEANGPVPCGASAFNGS